MPFLPPSLPIKPFEFMAFFLNYCYLSIYLLSVYHLSLIYLWYIYDLSIYHHLPCICLNIYVSVCLSICIPKYIGVTITQFIKWPLSVFVFRTDHLVLNKIHVLFSGEDYFSCSQNSFVARSLSVDLRPPNL